MGIISFLRGGESDETSNAEADSRIPADGAGIIETDGNEIPTDVTESGGVKSNRSKYEQNGILQNIIKAPADDATREWFNIEIDGDDDSKIADAIQQRLKELDFKNKTKEMIKFSRMHKKGSGIFFGIDAGDKLDDTTDLSGALPEKIKEIKYCNVLDNPDTFDVKSCETSDPTLADYGKIKIQVSSREIHESRFLYLVDDYDIEDEEGISVVDTVRKAIDAQEEAIAGTKNIFERIGAVLFQSESVTLSENTKDTIGKLMALIKRNLKRNKAMGLKPGDSASMLSYAFSGLKDAYEFVMDNLAGMSRIPRAIIISGLKGGIITGEGNKGELINYYRTIEGFQENTLEPLMRKTINLILREENSNIGKMINGKAIEYNIVWGALWSMTQKEDAEVSKLKSERDKIDFDAGKASGDELRMLDDRFKDLAQLTIPDPADDIEDEEK